MVNETEEIDGLPAAVSDELQLPDPYEFDYANSQLDPRLFSEISRLLEAGGTKAMAATAAGVDRATFYRWMKRGEQNVGSDDPLDRWGAFYLHIRRGIESYQARALSSIHDEKWKLERIYPEDFGKKSEQDITISDESDTYENKMTEEQWRKRQAANERLIETAEKYAGTDDE